jgi:hypothetical protein
MNMEIPLKKGDREHPPNSNRMTTEAMPVAITTRVMVISALFFKVLDLVRQDLQSGMLPRI